MTNLEIDLRLALALGWKPEQMRERFGSLQLHWLPEADAGHHTFDSWRRFSHLDHAVIWSIAERYDCFPRRLGGEWAAAIEGQLWQSSPIAATAVALAVIQGVKHGQR